MKNQKHNSFYGWAGASQDASDVLRGAIVARMNDVSPQDMAKN